MNKLKELYLELFYEIQKNQELLLKSIEPYIINKSAFPSPNQNYFRYNKPNGYTTDQVSYIELNIFNFKVKQIIIDLDITRKIFDFIFDNNLSIFLNRSFDEDRYCEPSITQNLIADFVGRMYELSRYNSNLIFTEKEFNKTFEELEDFLYSDTINYKVLYNLYGPLGNIDIINTEDFKIKKADYFLSQLFCYHYSDTGSSFLGFEMLENDYYIEIDINIDKKNKNDIHDYLQILNHDTDIVRKRVFYILLLSSSGNIELGKYLKIGRSWPFIKMQRSIISSDINKYDVSNKFRYEFNKETEFEIIKNYNLLKDINFEKLDNKILSSLERLKRAKATKKIEDRIVELALCVEYLIKTDYEVTLQLCLKIIKMLDFTNQNEDFFKKLKDFYSLRGKVVHGGVNDFKDKDFSVVEYVERIILKFLVKFILLSQKYSSKEIYEKINDALTKSLYINKSVEEIFDEIINQENIKEINNKKKT